VNIEAELFDGAGELVATARTNNLITKFKPDYNKYLDG